MKYECKRCGACCSPGFIRGAVYTAAIARPHDRPRIAEHFGLTDEELCEKYKINPRDGHMRTDKEPCRFLAENKDCSIHEIKPLLCTAYPWNNIYENPLTRLEYMSRCPGIELEQSDMKEIHKALLQMNAGILDRHKEEVYSNTPNPAEMWEEWMDSKEIPNMGDCIVIVDAMHARQDLARALLLNEQKVV